jgi:hypothetical protein
MAVTRLAILQGSGVDPQPFNHENGWIRENEDIHPMPPPSKIIKILNVILPAGGRFEVFSGDGQLRYLCKHRALIDDKDIAL